ncbi:MAG TPA: hypothetical protein DDZ88_25590 [Verrucomicrobiales bacterium]|nr:hypothetical protein [Verrucomicrobiales bacterium]
MTAKTLTLRLSVAAYDRATSLARTRKQSLNRLFQEGLELLDHRERERQLFDDFSMIADSGPTETDVDFALDTQTQAASER